MPHNQFALLIDRRFLPLFVTQFFGAFHDNLFKNALVVLLLFGPAAHARSAMLATLAGAVFILPYILFTAIGGHLADACPKHAIIRIIKAIEIAIAALGIASLATGSVWLSFVCLFALGTHSAFFGPCKYAILPEHLQTNELVGGNAFLNTGTFLSILGGTLVATSFAASPHGIVTVCCLIGVCAVAGYAASRFIPAAPASITAKTGSLNPFVKTHEVLSCAFGQPRGVVLAMLGNAWFWFMGSMFMTQLPNYVHDTLGGDERILTAFLALFSVGIAAGGLCNDRLLKGRIEATYVPAAAIGITLFCLDLFVAGEAMAGHWPVRAGVDVLMIGVFGGLFIVPLNAIIQNRTPAILRARVIAGSGLLDALFMLASAGFSASLIACGADIRSLFAVYAAANACVALYICRLLPDYLVKSLLQAVFKILYKVEVRGLENFDKAGKRAVIVGNHASFLDPPLLAAFLPGRTMFAVNTQVAGWWWVKPFLKLADIFPLDPTNPFSLKSLIHEVGKDRHVIIFPEGRLTATGSLMKIYDGPGMVADKADAMILPVRLDGVQHTPFTRLKGKVPLKTFPKITITILEPRRFKIDPALKGRARRAAAGDLLYDLMESMMFLTSDRQQTLFEALLKAAHVNGPDSYIAEDASFAPLKFKTLLGRSVVLGRTFETFTSAGENVGVLLPNSLACLSVFFALEAIGRVPAMLNFSAGPKALESACRTACIKTIVTSRKFIDLARLAETLRRVEGRCRIVYMEDIAQSVTALDRLAAALTDPAAFHARRKRGFCDPAVVLFTSGSEGEPKGVVLSHENIMTNVVQLTCRADFDRRDLVFNCLPMFHSFGLTGGTLLPVLSGIRTFLYPTPLHYRIIPEMIYATNATIMFGTDTFLQGYGHMAHAYDFYRMRYVFAGAEKVKDETRALYMNKFGVQILEGYGATETAPVIAVNSPMYRKNGTVGKMLAGLEHRLEPVEGIERGGRLHVKGPNVMLGYYTFAEPGVIRPAEGGWHDTGDIVDIDPQGFVTLLGRAKRFSKIGGEMVSLALVEDMAQAVWPDERHAAIAAPHPAKGEEIVLATTRAAPDRHALFAHAAANGLSALAVPARVIHVPAIPVLGSGKTDYPALRALCEGALAPASSF